MSKDEYSRLRKVSSGAEVLRKIAELVTRDFDVLGVGSASAKSNATVFVVVKWPQMNQVRAAFGLEHKDFHVTLGFKQSDIHGVAKDETSLVGDDVDQLAAKIAAMKV